MRWKLTMGLFVAAAIGASLWLSAEGSHGELEQLEETRRALRGQGFKTDLSEFNFFTSPELQAREAALTNAVSMSRSGGQAEARRRSMRQQLLPDLMQPVGRDAAMVVWEQSKLPWDASKQRVMREAGFSAEDPWAALRELFAADQAVLDAACLAALSGPIRFNLNASYGSDMLLPHLPAFKNLARTLGGRAVLELHDGNRDAAWTNTLATTRLVTGWTPEPTEVSALVRFACATIASDTVWQMLSAGGWEEARLAALQREWESVDFLAGLPEIAAFARAGAVALCQQERQQPGPGWGLPFTIKEAIRSPRQSWFALDHYRRRVRYRHQGSYEDERNLLIHYRDRELELKRALTSQSWTEMRRLPGVTNITRFQSRHTSAALSRLETRQIMSLAMYGSPGQIQSLPGRAADAEARRRLLVTAIALERQRSRNGSYPEALSQLVPGLLREPPVDFMDGQPLRYRLTDDGHYVLYSVGLDGIDHDGELPRPQGQGLPSEAQRRIVGGQETDLVWPRPASVFEAQAQAAAEARQAEEAMQAALKRAAEEEERREALRRATVRRLVEEAESGKTPVSGGGPKEPKYRGQPMSQFLRNPETPGDAPSRLCDMLALRQIITGQEPDVATFEVPIRYDALTNFGILELMVDVEPVEDSESIGGQVQVCERASNGNCRLVWNTTYDRPGEHALHVRLLDTETISGERFEIRGPVLPFYSTNILQFDPFYSSFDSSGAILYARLAEPHGIYRIEIKSPTGALIRTLEGTTTDGEIMVEWDLKNENGERYTGESITCTFHVTLPESGRSQTQEGR